MNLSRIKLKKVFSLYLLVFVILVLIGCQPTEKPKYTVTFDSDGGRAVESQVVEKGKFAVKPETDPEKLDYLFEYWMDSAGDEFIFETTPIESDVTLKAFYTENTSTLTLIEQDIQALEAEFRISDYQLNLIRRGSVNRSTVTWSTTSQYLTTTGYVIPLLPGDTTETAVMRGRFTLKGETVVRDFVVDLTGKKDVVIETVRWVEFKNLTTEYEVANGSLNLYFEKDGNVPYVNVVDFLGLLEGFVDPEVDFEVTYEGDAVELYYQYTDEDSLEVYDLRVTIDAETNLITTNDPGFYWAYIYSTATNYGRHIEYDRDNPDAHSYEGSDVIYDLNKYNLDITTYNDQVLMPYYIANQLFAGSSYYNVYYNQDYLYGIYGTPDEGSTEYTSIRSSSLNGKEIPADLLVHTFNMLAFNMDNFYGLREIMEVETYYDLLFTKRNRLFDKDPAVVDQAIASLLMVDIDEPHTSYGYPSYFNNSTWGGPSVSSLSDYGMRFVTWYYNGYIAVDDAIEAKWGRGGIASNAWAASSPNRPAFWFLDDETVVVILDSFRTQDIQESSTHTDEYVSELMGVDNLLPTVNGNKFFYINNSDKKDNLMEVLVKGVDASYVDTYAALLVADGYTLASGIYSKTVGAATYSVQLDFNETYQLFYVGITNKARNIAKPNIINLVKGDSAVYMEMVLEKASQEKPGLTRALLDLTWNTGGNVGALYRVLGFITDQPFRVSSIDGNTGGSSSSFVYIDGVPTYAHLNWGLLISPLTFSAANSMATIFMENELGVIIGKTSGGGASSITPILLPNGTAFTMSSNNISAYRTGTGTEADPYVYNHNEFGITPDFEVEMTNIFNNQVLLDILNSLD